MKLIKSKTKQLIKLTVRNLSVTAFDIGSCAVIVPRDIFAIISHIVVIPVNVLSIDVI